MLTPPFGLHIPACCSPFAASAVQQPVGGEGSSSAAVAAQHHIMVRRLAALPGDELVTGEDEEAESYVLPEGMCWVLADNDKLAPPDVIDSRSFGPLPLVRVRRWATWMVVPRRAGMHNPHSPSPRPAVEHHRAHPVRGTQ